MDQIWYGYILHYTDYAVDGKEREDTVKKMLHLQVPGKRRRGGSRKDD